MSRTLIKVGAVLDATSQINAAKTAVSSAKQYIDTLFSGSIMCCGECANGFNLILNSYKKHREPR